ncbi:hypothetical protein ACJMK2_036987 [Sinanodonta woodiana]|uniref:RecA family profile 1 domain-containing protein n=1 Tax=Sinanodonta woodiana TaxID=1069815 RepID=A0ABD3WIV8_SINWO
MLVLRVTHLDSFESILTLSNADISRITGLSLAEVQTLKTKVAENVVDITPITALDLHQGRGGDLMQIRKLSTGCAKLDEALRGGILSRGITEISGESASGKTQFCLQLALTVQLPQANGGLQGGVAYICTEDAFPSKRLHQMTQGFMKVHRQTLGSDYRPGDKIFIEHVADYDMLMTCVNQRLPLLLASTCVRLIIVDSVTAVFRGEYAGHELYKRSKHLSSLVTQLLALGSQHNIPVVCINQVSSSMNETGRQLIPALGLAWSNMIMTRIMLSRTNQTITLNDSGVDGRTEATIRQLEVIFAPHLTNVTVLYVIDRDGIKGIT